jgi:hypothetical protein
VKRGRLSPGPLALPPSPASARCFHIIRGDQLSHPGGTRALGPVPNLILVNASPTEMSTQRKVKATVLKVKELGHKDTSK